MKFLFLTFLVSISFLEVNVSELRTKFPEAHTNSELTDDLYAKLSSITSGDKPLLVAYKGAILTLKAKHAKSLKEKKGFFKEGALLLESAIEQAPTSLEIRCLRLSVQEHAPKVVRYNANIDEDKLFILTNYSSKKELEVKNFIKKYVANSTLFTDEEKQAF